MDEDFSEFYYNEHFGPALETREVPEASLQKFRHRLPDKLLEYWRDYGWAGYGNGLFWVIDPDEYAPAVDAWLEGTPFCESDTYHAIAVSAFGELFLWGERTGDSLSVEAAYGMLFPAAANRTISDDRKDLKVRTFFSHQNKQDLDHEDNDEELLFNRAVKRLGVLSKGQIYGFVPALALGGDGDLEDLQKVDAVTHLVMLAQIGEKRIMRDVVAEDLASGLYDRIVAETRLEPPPDSD